jgi:hypothetical protein
VLRWYVTWDNYSHIRWQFTLIESNHDNNFKCKCIITYCKHSNVSFNGIYIKKKMILSDS